MQLQELKRLVEFNAEGELVATNLPDGWVLAIFKKRKLDDKDYTLETARGGTRKFKTLDALAKLVKTELNGLSFRVC